MLQPLSSILHPSQATVLLCTHLETTVMVIAGLFDIMENITIQPKYVDIVIFH